MINFLSFLLEAAGPRYVPGSFEVFDKDSYRNSMLAVTKHIYRYKLSDNTYAHGQVSIDGMPNHDHDLSTIHKGIFDEDGNELKVDNKSRFAITGHGAHNQIAAATRDAVKDHFKAFPSTRSIQGISIDTTHDDWSRQLETDPRDIVTAEKKFQWRLRSLKPLEADGYKVEASRDRPFGTPESKEYSIYPPEPK